MEDLIERIGHLRKFKNDLSLMMCFRRGELFYCEDDYDYDKYKEFLESRYRKLDENFRKEFDSVRFELDDGIVIELTKGNFYIA